MLNVIQSSLERGALPGSMFRRVAKTWGAHRSSLRCLSTRVRLSSKQSPRLWLRGGVAFATAAAASVAATQSAWCSSDGVVDQVELSDKEARDQSPVECGSEAHVNLGDR